MKRFDVLAAGVAAGLIAVADMAAAQEGTGAPVLRARAEEILAFYPASAKARGLEGEAIVSCARHEDAVLGCTLTSEFPTSEGFGAAALALAKRYEAQVSTEESQRFGYIEPFRFFFRLPKAESFRASGVEYVLPQRIEGPSLDALYDAWPRAARFSGVEGWVDLWCTVTLDGRSTACTVGTESSAGLGFGEAALKLAPLYRFAPALKGGMPVAMSIPVRVNFTCDARCRPFEARRSYAAPGDWTAVPTSARIQAAYPAAAKSRGVEGQARLDCDVKNGGLENCRVVAESLGGEGFGAAALKLADQFRVSLGSKWISFSVAFDTQMGQIDQAWDASTDAFVASAPQKGQAFIQPERRLSVRCQAAQGGKLQACVVLDAEPVDAQVTRQLQENVSKIRVRSWTKEGRSTIGSSVVLKVSTGPFVNPGLVAVAALPPIVPPGVIDYRPQAVLEAPADPSRLFPDRAQRMEVNGRAVVTCASLNEGLPEGCQITTEAPLEYGFGEAALKMSRASRYSHQSVNGVPTDEPVVISTVFNVPR